MTDKLTYFVTVGRFRVYYQFESATGMRATYVSYSGNSVYNKIDLINGLDKLAVISLTYQLK